MTTSSTTTIFDTLAVQRRPLAMGLTVLGIIFSALAIWWVLWGWPTQVSANDADADTTLLGKKDKDKEREKEKDKEKDKEQTPRKHSEDYFPAGIWAGMLALCTFGGAVWLVTQPLPSQGTAGVVRAELLTYGSVVGILTSLLGVGFAVSWYKSLFLWVNENNVNEARWVLIAMAVFVGGLVIVFMSVQLARTEERTNALLRRVAYGFNAVFLGLLLLLVLAAANVVSFMKLPGTLVTNDAAFTSLAEPSKKFLRSMDRPVHVYLVMPEGIKFPVGGMRYENLYSDCRGLLAQCEEQSPKFKASYLSPGLDGKKIAQLLDKMKGGDKDKVELGMILAFGDNEDEYAFVPAEDLVNIIPLGEDDATLAFQGEHRLLTEIMSKQEAGTASVVYFTQDHGELSIQEGVRDPRRSANRMLKVLLDRKVTLKPLVLDDANPKVPDDAALVVVAGPQKPITAGSPTYKALEKYLKPTDPEQAPGKLLAYLPTIRGGTNDVAPSGLEGLLMEFGVLVDGSHRVVPVPEQFPIRLQQGIAYLPPDHIIVEPAGKTQGALAQSFTEAQYLLKSPRPVRPGAPNPAFKVTPLLTSPDGVATWLETDTNVNVALKAREIAKDEQQRAIKQFGTAPVPVAVTVSRAAPPGSTDKKADKPFMIVFGSDTMLQDRPDIPIVPDDLRQLAVTNSVDWLREREANIGIAPRKLPIYTLAKAPSLGSLVMLLGMLSACVIALGIGVWLSRRR